MSVMTDHHQITIRAGATPEQVHVVGNTKRGLSAGVVDCMCHRKAHLSTFADNITVH